MVRIMHYSVFVAATLALFNFVGAAPISNTNVESVERLPVAKREDVDDITNGLGLIQTGGGIIPLIVGDELLADLAPPQGDNGGRL